MKFGKRGISPLISTIILVAICVAGGLMIYSVFFSTAGTMSAKGQLTVESMDLVRDTDGNIVFAITIKNTGNKPVKDDVAALKITLDGEDAKEVAEAVNLQPGQSVSKALYYSADGDDTNDEISGNYVIGKSYNVVIEATFSDGSTFAETVSVKCRGG